MHNFLQDCANLCNIKICNRERTQNRKGRVIIMRRSIKKAMSLTLASAMTLSLAACGGSNTAKETTAAAAADTTAAAESSAAGDAADSQEPVELKFSWWGGDSRHEATEKAVAAFMEKYPYITVTTEYGAWSGWEEKQALNIMGGNAADVMQINWNWIESYSGNGTNFANLEDYSDVLDLTQFPSDALELCKADGKLMAVPVALTGRLFYWNKTTFDKIGVEIPTTLDELLAAGKAFEAYDESYYPMVTKELDRAFLMVYYLQCKYGKDWVKDGALQYSQEEIAEGFDFLKNLEDNHVIPTLQKVAGDGADLIDTNANWIDGHYAGIFLYDTSVVKHAEAVKDGEFVIGDYIKMGDYHGGFIKVNQAFGISATTEHPAEAAALIQFLVAEEDGVKTLGDTRGVPANKAGLAMLDLSGSQVAEANAKVMEWSSFQMDPTFERSSFTGADGTFFNALQLSSYGESDSMSCAQIVMDGVAKELAASGS